MSTKIFSPGNFTKNVLLQSDLKEIANPTIYSNSEINLENLIVTADIDNDVSNSLCRLCLKHSGNLAQYLFNKTDDITIAEMVTYCTSIEIIELESTKLPTFICYNCFLRLKISFHLKKEAIQSDEYLRNMDEIIETEGQKDYEDVIDEVNEMFYIEHEVEVENDNSEFSAPPADQCHQLKEEYSVSDDLIYEQFIEESDEFQSEEMNQDHEITLCSNIEVKDEKISPPIETVEVKKSIFKNLEGEFFECECCFKKIYSKSSLKNHMKHHVRLKEYAPLNCTDCQKNFYLRESLEQHICMNPVNLKCFICDQHFKTIRLVKSHISSEHKNNRICHCGVKLKTAQRLNKHMKMHVYEENFSCSFCPRNFNDRVAFLKHENQHKTIRSLFICDICGNSFTFKSNMKKHMEAIHMKKKFQCNKCLVEFTSTDNLKTHQIKVHGMASDIFCRKCKKKYHYQSQLKIHLMNVASCRNYPLNAEYSQSVKLLKCSYCSKLFGNRTNLKRHELIHTNERNFECDMCEKRFIQKEGLDAHRNVHLREVQYKCPQCSKIYTSRSTLCKHLEKVHRKQNNNNKLLHDIC